MTSKPSATNCPNTFIRAVRSVAPSVPVWHGQDIRRGLCGFRIYGHLLVPCHPHVPLPLSGACRVRNLRSGGYCGRVPPLPIPNREVKPARADGTAMQCGRVGHRLLYCLPGASGHPGRLFCFYGVKRSKGRVKGVVELKELCCLLSIPLGRREESRLYMGIAESFVVDICSI